VVCRVLDLLSSVTERYKWVAQSPKLGGGGGPKISQSKKFGPLHPCSWLPRQPYLRMYSSGNLPYYIRTLRVSNYVVVCMYILRTSTYLLLSCLIQSLRPAPQN
jgi:hypothetical protein